MSSFKRFKPNPSFEAQSSNHQQEPRFKRAHEGDSDMSGSKRRMKAEASPGTLAGHRVQGERGGDVSRVM